MYDDFLSVAGGEQLEYRCVRIGAGCVAGVAYEGGYLRHQCGEALRGSSSSSNFDVALRAPRLSAWQAEVVPQICTAR